MEPQETQTQGTQVGAQPSSQSQDQSLNPQIISLADSIAQTESGGNSKAKGKSGEYGAYQWTAPTWASESAAAGVNVPLDQSTPEQQNQVAYNEISTLKNQGLTPAQIASKWNSGEPNAYLGSFDDGEPSEGTNSYGAAYNVPNYVSNVMSKYDASQGSSNPLVNTANAATGPSGNQSSGSSQPDWLSAAEGLGGGALGWLLGKAGGYVKNAIPDVATDAALGTEAGPEGTLAGAGVGLVQAGIQDALGSNSTQTPTDTPQDSNTPQTDVPQPGTPAPNPADQEAIAAGEKQPVQQPETTQPNPETPQSENQQSAQATSQVSEGINQMLQGTQGDRVFSQNPDGQSAINTAAAFRLISPDENGAMQFDEEKRKQLLGEVSNLDDKAIESDGSSASPRSVANYAGNYIGSSRLNTLEEKDDAAEKVKKSLMREAPNGINGQMSLSTMRERQKEHGAAAKGKFGEAKTSADILHHKAMRDAYGKAISENLKDPTAKELHKRALKMEQDLIRSKDIGKRLNGKKIPKEKGVWESFLRQGARAAEIYIGDKLGGPIGAILGATLGEHLNHSLDKKFGRNIFETKSMKAALGALKDTKPKEYQELIDKLKEHGADIPEEPKKPSTKEGLVKAVGKDEKIIKGLVKPPKQK